MEGFTLAESVSRLKHAFYLLKKRLKGGTPPQHKHPLKEAAVKAWKSITKEECKGLVTSAGHRPDALVASNGFAAKYNKSHSL